MDPLRKAGRATSVQLYQDYGGFTEVPDDDLRKYAAMLGHN